MSFFNKLFGSDNQSTDNKVDKPIYSAGRYVDINKSKQQTEYWEKAKKEFSEKKYIDSFESLLLYMNDPEINNITFKRVDNAIEFELEQGSKIIKGQADENSFVAETRIARYERLSVAFLRKLMNMNYVLQYSRFAIKEDVIFLKSTSKSIDASPNKLYYSLKELALKADKIDDALVNEFEILKPIDVSHIKELSDQIKEIKYNYLIKWINADLDRISKLNEERMAGAISYILLSLIYRIDYLLTPQGNILNDIEKINGIFNGNESSTPVEKNRMMVEELKKLAEKDKEKIKQEFYDIKATFGYVSATTHKTFYEFLLEQFKNTSWYYDNKHEDIVSSIYEYCAGYTMFNYGLYNVTYDLIQLTNNVLHNDFFRDMGIPVEYYNASTGKFNIQAIEKATQSIINKYRKEYPKLTMAMQKIRYGNINEFLFTYLNEITYLNFSK